MIDRKETPWGKIVRHLTRKLTGRLYRKMVFREALADELGRLRASVVEHRFGVSSNKVYEPEDEFVMHQFLTFMLQVLYFTCSQRDHSPSSKT